MNHEGIPLISAALALATAAAAPAADETRTERVEFEAGKSFGQVHFPEPNAAGLFDGYQGGYEYEMMENAFVRRFPLHGQAAETRQFQFKLNPARR